ncbi:hypothetical protein COS44_00195 [bacterium (Candidatus Gribaldobacteria) CG03_land_8_20_14_0_80_36_40]|uniref:Uncharacterized protein n=1 Tax=bacterium (Candidatus Gribaldobacteria) CG03_land_8_20_14_0_80_36_40 TaxID=2014271 RepID=A0A2M7BZN9_9BACT|nr:MAG: hypothetical protein COS44_00195 [bacterium (Candidatus Gribaldobacteria) CG03_land_8_20_14_0_80_36_40]
MEFTYSNIKNIDRTSTAGIVIRDKELTTKKINPSVEVSSQTAPFISPPQKTKKKDQSTPSPTPASE